MPDCAESGTSLYRVRVLLVAISARACLPCENDKEPDASKNISLFLLMDNVFIKLLENLLFLVARDARVLDPVNLPSFLFRSNSKASFRPFFRQYLLDQSGANAPPTRPYGLTRIFGFNPSKNEFVNILCHCGPPVVPWPPVTPP